MVKARLHGQTARHTQGGSKMERCMGLAFINLEMAKHMKDTMQTTRKKVMESIHLKQEQFTKESLKITSNTVKEFSSVLTEEKSEGNGQEAISYDNRKSERQEPNNYLYYRVLNLLKFLSFKLLVLVDNLVLMFH